MAATGVAFARQFKPGRGGADTSGMGVPSQPRGPHPAARIRSACGLLALGALCALASAPAASASLTEPVFGCRYPSAPHREKSHVHLSPQKRAECAQQRREERLARLGERRRLHREASDEAAASNQRRRAQRAALIRQARHRHAEALLVPAEARLAEAQTSLSEAEARFSEAIARGETEELHELNAAVSAAERAVVRAERELEEIRRRI